MKLISWNVNGLRAVMKKNFEAFLETEQPDVLCLQETKMSEEILAPAWAEHYATHWNLAAKKGYSGTAILTRAKTPGVTKGVGIGEHNNEGRVLTAELDEFFVVNVYVPNSKRDLSRLEYRQQWDRDFLAYLKHLEKRKPVIFCGDLNVAHTEIDLARPKGNEKNHGFTIEERNGFQTFLDAGFVDTFRIFEPAGGHYSWWSQMGGARKKNIGWRIDYFLCSEVLRPRIKSATILKEIMGSDHCPVQMEIE